jgi:hypothetical protein
VGGLGECVECGVGRGKGTCSSCRRAARYLLHKPEMLRKTQEWRVNSPAEYLLSAAKQRARRGGLAFDIEVTDIVVPERCPLLGLRLVPFGGKRTDATPSLDRVDPATGYVKGNVWVISWRANRLKNNATFQELEAIVLGMRVAMSRQAAHYFRSRLISKDDIRLVGS